MSRLRKLELDELDPDLREMTQVDDRTPIEVGLTPILGHAPDLAKGLMAFAGSLKRRGTLPRRLVELVRLRVAFHNQCRSCMAIRYQDAIDDGLTEDLVCSLEQPYEAPDLTDAERLAVRYGELLASNHLAIDDDMYGQLLEHFTEEQVVELGLQVALFVGVGRLAATWHVVEDLPEAFAADGRITPTVDEGVVVR
ncbi:MAG: carboxymuconolactone decarboxylase family protein [Actinomycetota bacterium]